MHLSIRGEILIQTLESLSLVSYPDSEGNLTIGWGHLMIIDKNKPSLTISPEEADDLFDLDIKEKVIPSLEKVRIIRQQKGMILPDQYEWDALSSFVFNVGSFAFESSKIYHDLTFHSDIKGDKLSNSLLIWNKETIKGIKRLNVGLACRREVEKRFYNGGFDSIPIDQLSKEIELYKGSVRAKYKTK